ncbi:hypothetical protein VHUM_00809 [Vanrija humicola]|uniref:Uncharacterized protein n=1 Tax=Vanrija humicola TaxID=5417 RepID=A0A7D8V324_VANHU|nr:hypothetical protein VHUM_00809 [Vanrija humicola]
MHELLEKAHEEDEKDKDGLFAEEEDDADFEAPAEQRDVFMDEFADTDEEIEDEDNEEREVRREERRKAKQKAGFNPLVKIHRAGESSGPKISTEALSLLDPTIDPTKMAKSTLVLEIRRQKREQKRLNRSEARRSNLRTSTLRMEEDVKERLAAEKAALATSRKGRKAQHVTGEIRGARPMTQDELIAAALEEEERNKEALTNWLQREEERRELRRVGRKRVVGPRMTWISRTVGKLIEVVGEESAEDGEKGEAEAGPSHKPGDQTEEVKVGDQKADGDKGGDDKGAEAGPAVGSADDKSRAQPTDQAVPPAQSPPKDEEPKVDAPKPDSVMEVDTPNDDKLKADGPKQDDAPAAVTETNASTKATSPTPDGKPDKVSTDGEVASKPDSAAVADKAGPQPPADQAPAVEPAVASTDATTSPKPDADKATETTAPAPAAEPSSTEPPEKVNAEGHEETAPKAASEAAVNGSPAERQPPGDKDGAKPKPDGPTDTLAKATTPAPEQGAAPDATNAQYTRNYLILSEIPGGLPAELNLILGDHVDWSSVKVIPPRNRPINRRPPLDLMTGQPARYRHPSTGMPYTSTESFKTLEALLAQRYVWSPAGWWAGGEADMGAEGVDDVPGWREAVAGGWLNGHEVVEEVDVPEEELIEIEEDAEEDAAEAEAEDGEEEEEEDEDEEEAPPSKRRKTAKGKGKAKAAPKKGSKAAKKPAKKAATTKKAAAKASSRTKATAEAATPKRKSAPKRKKK